MSVYYFGKGTMIIGSVPNGEMIDGSRNGTARFSSTNDNMSIVWLFPLDDKTIFWRI